MTLSFEFYGLAISIVGVIITIVKMWLSSNEKLAEHKQFVVKSLAVQEALILDNQTHIEEHKAQSEKEMEQIRRDRADRVAAVYTEIENIKKMRETDVKELTAAMRESIKQTTLVEERHHYEVMAEIKQLTVQLTDMCSTFKEYRSTRNGKG